MSPTKVLLIGTGAIGFLVASRLRNCELSLVSRSNYEFIRQKGISIQSNIYGNSTTTDFMVYQSTSEINQTVFDHILICTKTTANSAVCSSIGHLIHKNTIIHLFQNGINTEIEFIQKYPKTRLFIYSCFVRATLANNILVHSGDTIFTFGCHDGIDNVDLVHDRAEFVQDWISHLDLNLSYSENIQWKRFHKLFWNATFNPLSVVLDSSVTKMLDDDGVMELVLGIMNEVEILATRLYGSRPVEFSSPKELINTTRRIYRQNGEHTPSMFIDYRNGKECEVEVTIDFILGILRSD
jgi:2-dehydropantoate 2-reductase